MKLLLASSNPGKLREYLELARGTNVEIELLPDFSSFPRSRSPLRPLRRMPPGRRCTTADSQTSRSWRTILG